MCIESKFKMIENANVIRVTSVLEYIHSVRVRGYIHVVEKYSVFHNLVQREKWHAYHKKNWCLDILEKI
jgi:hypothetical protein